MEAIVKERPSSGLFSTYAEAVIPQTAETVSTGWLPPMPDFRDYTEDSADIPKMASTLNIPSTNNLGALPSNMDLRRWCSPVKNQGEVTG